MAGRIVYLFSCVNYYSHATVRGMSSKPMSVGWAIVIIVLTMLVSFAVAITESEMNSQFRQLNERLDRLEQRIK